MLIKFCLKIYRPITGMVDKTREMTSSVILICYKTMPYRLFLTRIDAFSVQMPM